MTMDFSRIEKKLRQARFLLGHLGTPRVPGRSIEHEEFYLSACLTAAQSAHYVLEKEVGRRGIRFQRERHRWSKTLQDGDYPFFQYMKNVRDDDVHHGMIDAQAMTKYVDAQRMSGVSVFGLETIELENPDGSRVRGHGALVGIPALYFEYGGRRVEASTACDGCVPSSVEKAVWRNAPAGG